MEIDQQTRIDYNIEIIPFGIDFRIQFEHILGALLPNKCDLVEAFEFWYSASSVLVPKRRGGAARNDFGIILEPFLDPFWFSFR